MRIGIDTHFVTSVQATGNRTYTTELVRALLQLDRENDYILYAVADHPYYQQFAGNQRVQVRPVLSGNGLARNFVALPKAIGQDAPDLVHLQFILPWFVRSPAVLAVHDIYYSHLTKPSFYERVLAQLTVWSIRRADEIVTLSEYSRQDIITRCQIKPERITFVPGGVGKRFAPVVDDERHQSLRSKLGIYRDYLLFLGRTEDPRKNIATLLDAYTQLRQAGEVNEQLVIAGRHGPDTPALLADIRAKGLQEDILLPGIVPDEDLPTLLSGARLFVYVSTFEGFGLPVLEAAACGTPVITSNTTSLPEVAGDAGVLVTPGNAEELKTAMRRVLHDPVLQQQMRERGLRHAATFSWERTANEMLKVYQKIITSQQKN